MIASNIICPFCGEDGFDLIGLKHHLENYCESYKSTHSWGDLENYCESYKSTHSWGEGRHPDK